jgi:hypothetical protein
MKKSVLVIGVLAALIGASAAWGQVSLKMWNTAEALANPITEVYLADFHFPLD